LLHFLDVISIAPLRELNCAIGLFLPCVHIGQRHMDMRYMQAHFCVRMIRVPNVRFLCKDSLWTCVTILWVPDERFSRRAVLENSGLINFVFERQASNIRLSKQQFVLLILATMLYRFKTVYLFLFIQGLACRLNHLWQAVFNIPVLCFAGVWAHSSGTTCSWSTLTNDQLWQQTT